MILRVISLFLVFCSTVNANFDFWSRNYTEKTPSRVINFDGDRIMIKGLRGNIKVFGWSNNFVSIYVTKKIEIKESLTEAEQKAIFSKINYSVVNDKETLAITSMIDDQTIPIKNASMNIDIMVPYKMSIGVISDIGNLDVLYLKSEKIFLKVNTGNISIDKVYPELDELEVQTGIGNIDVSIDKSVSAMIHSKVGLGIIKSFNTQSVGSCSNKNSRTKFVKVIQGKKETTKGWDDEAYLGDCTEESNKIKSKLTLTTNVGNITMSVD